MLHAVKKVRYIKDYKLELTFRNKETKIVDLKKELGGPMFEPLKDVNYFKQVKTDGHTIVWPNQADFCPDFLYEMGRSVAVKKRAASRKKKTNSITPEKPQSRMVAKSK